MEASTCYKLKMAKLFKSAANGRQYDIKFITEGWHEHSARFLLDRCRPDVTFLKEVADRLRAGIDNVDLIDYGNAERTFKRGFVLRESRPGKREAVAVTEFIYSGSKEGIVQVKARDENYINRVFAGLTGYAHLTAIDTKIPIDYRHAMEARV